MNNDSFFESEFFVENKGLITVFTSVSLAFITIFWLYKGLKNNNPNNNNINNQNLNSLNNSTVTNLNNQIPQKIVKRRLTINANDILIKDIDNIDLSQFYEDLDNLSKQFDLYLLILINENENQEKIIEKLSALVDDKIIYKHVKIII